MSASLVMAGFSALLALTAALASTNDEFVCPKDAPSLCESARVSLAKARSAVQSAADRRALWTTAAEALRDAQGAFLHGDYPGAQRAADTAIRQARLGIAQGAYPAFPFPDQ
jgi:hypothetical protein